MNFKELLESKKAKMAALAGGLVSFQTELGISAQEAKYLVVIAGAYLLAQGAADFMKARKAS